MHLFLCICAFIAIRDRNRNKPLFIGLTRWGKPSTITLWSIRALSALQIAFATRLGRDAYLILDDVIVEKPFAKRLPGQASSIRSPKSGISGVYSLWCWCGARMMVAGAFQSAFACGDPSAAAASSATKPSCKWPRKGAPAGSWRPGRVCHLLSRGEPHDRAPTWSPETPDGRWRSYTYDELLARDKVSLDIFWLRDKALEDRASLPDPDVLATEIVQDLQAALAQFAAIAADLDGEADLDDTALG